LDNDGNPLVPTGIMESDSEVEVLSRETANLRISTSGKDGSDKGYGTNSLLEQWRDSYPDMMITTRMMTIFQNSGVQNVGNQNGLIVVPGIANLNANQNGNGVTPRQGGNARRNTIGIITTH
ncbi:hypothetical protein Tco_1131536, partial [Tanacetum coccineum]